ncbi:MAG: hypothetical protein GC192_21390 [Bacteroidetes bacterium]|nr:hypothetical protein [Bacteroidota bacterium]
MFKNLHLNPGDRIVVPKSLFGIVQHHAIYAGDGWFYENKIGQGVVCTPWAEFFRGITEVTSVQRFTGNYLELRQALARAESSLGRAYNPVNFNCEHFANYVLYGRPASRQVENAGGILSALAVAFIGVQIIKSIE